MNVWDAIHGERASLADALAALPADEFMLELGLAFEHRLGEITAIGERAVIPLRGLEAARYIGPRLALIGDAAHVVHPMAGLGANLGIGDAAAFAQVIAEGPLANLVGRASQPEDVASAIVYLCLPGSRQITGQTIHTSAGAVV